MNKILLVGRLVRDPELRTTTAGFNTCNFTVAVNRKYKNKDGGYDADFLPCVAFRTQADFVVKYFKKGSLIGVEGSVQTRNYDDKDGNKRYVTEVNVENVEFVGGKNDSTPTSNAGSYVDNPAAEPVDAIPDYNIPDSDPYENYDSEVSLSDNDLPF